MRITVLCTDLGVRVPGNKGASMHLAAITSAFAALGHAVQLVGVAGHGEPPPGLADVQLLPHPGRAEGLRRERNKLAFVERVVHEIGPRVHDFAPELVYERLSLFGTAGARIARAGHCHHVVEVNALVAEEESTWRGLRQPALARRIERRTLAAADVAVAVSDEVSAQVARVAPATRRIVVPNGVDVDRFRVLPSRADARVELGLAPDRRIVCFVGALRPWHGVDIAIDAAARLHDVELVIVGDGPVRMALEARAVQHGVADRVRFLGQFPHEHVVRVLTAADAALAPYPALDGFAFSPLKLYEYLAAGVPVVASRIGQIPSILADGRWGALVRPGDAEDLAAALGRVLADPGEARRVATAARHHALTHHGWRSRAEDICAVVRDLPTKEPARALAR